MTELTRLYRAGALAGTLFTSALALCPALPAQAKPQSPQALPVPRYQSPGIQQPEAPTPQFRMPETPAITPNATVVEDVIVRVNDGIISRSDLQRAADGLRQELLQGRATSTDAEEREKNLLRDLIDQQLLLSKGKEMNINADAEVIRRLDDIRKQNNFPTMEALEQAARQTGVSFEDFKASIRNNIITGQVVRDEVGRNLHITRADETKYYNDHKADFAQPEQVRLSEILVPTAANADDAAIAAAQKSAQGIYDELKAGADFAATAKKSSGGPTAAQGGDLGQFKRGGLAPVLEQKTFALPAGGYTEPIRTRQGFVILRATEHQQAGTPPLEKIEAEVQNAMYQEEIQPALRAYLTKLREEAYVDLRPGFVDSGASAKETKPVFTAYVPPQPKKKKEETTKQRLESSNGRISGEKGGAAATAAAGKADAAAAAVPAKQELDRHGKPKKVKREKVRFGQAPRAALPAALATENAQAGDVAPGTAVSPLDASVNTVAANEIGTEADPLAETKPKPAAKTRYANREVEVKQRNVAEKKAKAVEKAKATPIAADDEEKTAAAQQAAALGLNGTTSKKQKVKRKKGDPKERLQTKPEEPKAPLVDNGLPNRLHQQSGPEKPSSDTTTLPPATQPAPGSTIPGQTPPTNGGAASPTSNQPVPQTPEQPR
jgi:peptidyl-prolyl cis-trans isomerase SurA